MNKYYILVDKKTLKFLTEEYDDYDIGKAVKYDTIEEAKEERETYDEDYRNNIVIYEMEEKIDRNLKLLEE